VEEIVEFYGHPLIKALHPTTLEVTKEDFLTEKGDCIIGIRANKACKDLKEELKEHLRKGGKIEIIIKVEDFKFSILAKGDAKLNFKSDKSLVVRKSKFVCNRTLAVEANKVAKDLPRDMVNLLKEGKRGYMIIKSI